MKDEIKEILREAKEYQYIDLNTEETDLLLDYITNLQKEKDDYKSRCENGINLIDRTIEIIKQQPTGNDDWILSRLYGFKYALENFKKQ